MALNSGASLIEAIDAAFVRTIESGEYFTTMDNVPINILPSDCYAFTEEYDYPALAAATQGEYVCEPTGGDATMIDYCNTSCFNGAGAIAPACFIEGDNEEFWHRCVCSNTPLLDEVLASGTVRVALPYGDSAYANVAFNPRGPAPAPAGPAIDLFESVIAAVGANYNTALTIEYVRKFGNDATFTAVNEGEADLVAPFAAIGGLVDVGNGDVRRRTSFQPSCGWFSSEQFLVVRAGEYSSLQSVRADNASVCLYIQFTGIASALFEAPTIIGGRNTVASAEAQCLAQLASGTVDAYLTDQIPVDLSADFVAVSTRLTPGTAFWSRY